MALTASCHCGAVQIEIARRPRVLTECTCSICRRYGAQWAYYTRRSVRILCAPDALTAYRRGRGALAFCHCKTCGCLTHYESADRSERGRVAVNARMLPPGEVAGVWVRLFDGARTGRYLD